MASGRGIALLREHMQSGLEFLKSEIQAELEAQGHRATGKLIDEIEIIITQKTEDVMRGEIKMQDYYTYINTGTRPHWPPFSAIYEWAKVVKRGEDDREIRSFSYAVQRTIAEQGTPTRGSFAYSRNGRRTEFSKFAIDNNQDQFKEILDLAAVFRVILDESSAEFLRRFNQSA